MKRSAMKPSTFAIPSTRKYPIPDLSHARNAIARVQKGYSSEKAAVYAAVRRKFPALAERSTTVPTKSGPGRRYREPKGTRH